MNGGEIGGGRQSEVASGSPRGYVHPTTVEEFEQIYNQEYQQELDSCDRWINWCKERNDYFGVNFYQGLQCALIFHNIKMCQLLRVLRQEPPNASQGLNMARGMGD